MVVKSLYQSPEGAPFRAVYPPNFRFEDGDLKQTLPEGWHPNCHVNYDNRCRVVADGLPKLLGAADAKPCDDEGNLLL